MSTAAPQLGVLIMDDGREFGDAACATIPAYRPTSVRLALEGAPERPGIRTLATVPSQGFTLRRAVELAAREGLFWISAPRDVQDPLTAFVDGARGAAGVLDEDHPGFAVVLGDQPWQAERIALVADVSDPITTGMAMWAAVGLAFRWGQQLDVLVLGVDESQDAPDGLDEALARFSLRGDSEELVRQALEHADSRGVQVNWKPLGQSLDKPGTVLRAVVSGNYDLVVDDLPPIKVGPKVGRRRRVQAALSQAGGKATAYRLVRDAPGGVAVVFDAARLGLIPEDMARAGAAAVAMGVVGVVGAAAVAPTSEQQVETTAAMTETDTGAAADAVAQAEAQVVAPDVASMTAEDLPALEAQASQAAAERDAAAAALAEQEARYAEQSAALEQTEAAQEELEPELDEAKTEADQASKTSSYMQIVTAGPLNLLPGTPSQEEADQAKAEAEAKSAEVAELSEQQQELAEQEEALAEEVSQLEESIATTAEEKAAAEQEAAVLSEAAADLQWQINPVVIPVQEGYFISTTYGVAGPYWSSGYHTGLDFGHDQGADVYAAKNGTVVQAGYNGAYGNQIVIQHADGTQSSYAHLSTMNVSVGQEVTAGQHIGDVGSTGNSTGPHLHMEVMDANGNLIDPAAWLGM